MCESLEPRSLFFCHSLQSLSSLEMALSHSFEVQSSPLYHLISGRVHRALGNMSSARSALETALRMCTSTTKKKVSRASVVVGGRGAGGRGRGELGPSQVATVYLELVAVLTKLGKQVSHTDTRVYNFRTRSCMLTA